MRTDDFDYDLPERAIAQAPASPRDSCKLLVLDRATGGISHQYFFDIGAYLKPGDLLVANRTRVMPARLLGHKQNTGGAAETLLLRRREDLDATGHIWECLVRPARRLKAGTIIEYRGASDPDEAPAAPVCLRAEILGQVAPDAAERLVRFEPVGTASLDVAIHAAGQLPLPPYITSYTGDPDQYQTVYAMQEEHSAAAPTAGLHFTDELIARLKAAGVGFATVELEVGIDTFRIVDEDDPTTHEMHTERYHVPQQVVDAVHATKAAGGRVVAVGTTAVRSLESAWDPAAPASEPAVVARYFEDAPDSARRTGAGDVVCRQDATTDLFLLPGSTFHVVDALITNFHVPRSTLMMLVSAFASREQIMGAYTDALAHNYRFLSFGDAMLIE